VLFTPLIKPVLREMPQRPRSCFIPGPAQRPGGRQPDDPGRDGRGEVTGHRRTVPDALPVLNAAGGPVIHRHAAEDVLAGRFAGPLPSV